MTYCADQLMSFVVSRLCQKTNIPAQGHGETLVDEPLGERYESAVDRDEASHLDQTVRSTEDNKCPEDDSDQEPQRPGGRQRISDGNEESRPNRA